MPSCRQQQEPTEATQARLNTAPERSRISGIHAGEDVNSIAATEAGKACCRLVEGVEDGREPIQITGTRGNAVLVGEDDGRALRETSVANVAGRRE